MFLLILRNRQGSTFFWTIAALIILSSLAAAISLLSPSASQSELAVNRRSRAYYAAFSGLSFARGLMAADLQAIHDGTIPGTYALAGQTFVLAVGTKNADGTFPVSVLGTAEAGKPIEANVSVAGVNVTPASSTPKETWTGGDYIVNVGNSTLALPQSAKVPTSVVGRGVLLNQYAEVRGDVVSSLDATLGQYGKVGGVVCAQNGNVMLNQYAEVTRDISANGNITLGQYAIAHQNAYARDNIYMNQYSKIMQTGQAGGTINRASDDYIRTPIKGVTPLITCPDASAPTAPAISCPATTDVPSSNPSHPIPPGDYKRWNPATRAKAYLKSGTYTFASIQFNQYTDLYLDISSGEQLTILNCGDVSTGQYTNVWVKTSASGGYDRVSDASPRSAAKLIYLGSDSNILFNQYGEWFGTVYVKNNLTTGQYFNLVGALASHNTMTINSDVTMFEYVLADYAKQHWTKGP